MSITRLIEYQEASEEIKLVYDDIMATRGTNWVNNFWKVLATQPFLLKRTWEGVKSVMADGALDSLTKEMVYIAVSATNSCNYCTNSHTAGARSKGMTDDMFAELMAIVGMANQTNSLADGFQVEVDMQFVNGGRR